MWGPTVDFTSVHVGGSSPRFLDNMHRQRVCKCKGDCGRDQSTCQEVMQRKKLTQSKKGENGNNKGKVLHVEGIWIERRARGRGGLEDYGKRREAGISPFKAVGLCTSRPRENRVALSGKQEKHNAKKLPSLSLLPRKVRTRKDVKQSMGNRRKQGATNCW